MRKSKVSEYVGGGHTLYVFTLVRRCEEGSGILLWELFTTKAEITVMGPR